MNYHLDKGELRVQKRDLKDLKRLYNSRKTKHKGLPIVTVDPPLHKYT